MPEYANQTSAVRNLQRYLRRLSFGESTIPDPPIDGIFDSRTEQALREFQRLRGFPMTGHADRQTWERLYEDYRAAQALGAQPQRVALFPVTPDGYMLDPNTRGFVVTALQYMLRELGHNHKELSDLPITGIYDDATAKAVRLFQSRNNIPEDGLVGLLTWNALTDQYNLLFLRADRE